MHGGSIIKCLEKQLLCHVYHQSRIFGNKRSAIKYHYPLITFQNHFTNLLNSLFEDQILCGSNPEIKQFLQKNACGKKFIITTFMEIFHVDRCTAKDLLMKNLNFITLPKKKIIDNYQVLQTAGLNTTILQNNILLLSQDTEYLQEKINILQRFINDINDGVPLMYCSANVLRDFTKLNLIANEENCTQNSFKYLETQLEMKPKELYNILAKYMSYILQEPKVTVQKLKLLLDYEISVNSLIQKDWPMYCAYEKMQRRLETFSKNGLLPPPKPWILNSHDLLFDRKVRKEIDIELEQSRLVDFLSKESGYSTRLILYKINDIQRNKFPKFDQAKTVINTIIVEGYTYHDIIRSLKILELKNNFIEERFSELRLNNCKAPFLDVLLLSKEAFANYVNNFSKKSK